MNRLGIEFLSVFGMNPVEQVALAADLGCAYISTGLTQYPPGDAPWSLRDDPALRRNLIAAMRDRGVSISLGEGFIVRPGVEMRERGEEMDLFAELGARGLGGVCIDPDLTRGADQLAVLAEMAHARGMLATLEFAPIMTVRNLAEAVAMVRSVDQPDFRICFDAMHFFRSGGTVAEIEALDPALIGYVQLCDVPLVPVEPDYVQEAMIARLRPGEGDLPLADFAAAMPEDVPVGLEIPNRALVEAGLSDVQRLGPAVETARRLFG